LIDPFPLYDPSSSKLHFIGSDCDKLSSRIPDAVVTLPETITFAIPSFLGNVMSLSCAPQSMPQSSQNSWTGFRMNSKVVMRMISTLQTQHSDLEGWRRLPKIGIHVGTTGVRMSNLWEWTHIYRLPPSDYAAGASWDTWHASDLDTLVKESKFKLAQSLVQSQPLARRLQWTQIPTQPN